MPTATPGPYCQHTGGAEIADRPGLAAALGALREHQATAFVAAKRDRFARDIAVSAEIDRHAARAGARTFASDGWGNGDDDGAACSVTWGRCSPRTSAG